MGIYRTKHKESHNMQKKIMTDVPYFCDITKSLAQDRSWIFLNEKQIVLLNNRSMKHIASLLEDYSKSTNAIVEPTASFQVQLIQSL